MTTDASTIAAALRPVLRRDIARAREELADLEQLLGRQPVQKSARRFLKVIEMAEAHFTAPMLKALQLGLDVHDLAERWIARVAKAADQKSIDNAAAFVKGMNPDPQLLQENVESMYGAGHVIGAAEAADWIQQGSAEPTQRELDQHVGAIDWSKWTPGTNADVDELADLEGSGSLKTLLDGADQLVASMTDTQVASIAGILVDAAAAGDSVDALASKLFDFFGDTARAELIATTELNRAVTASTLETYAGNGIGEFNVLTFQPCPICADQQANNPHALDDNAPPYHPRCRCAATPGITE